METDVCIQELPVATPEKTVVFWSDLLLAWVDQWRRWLLGAVVAVYAAGINGQWRMEPDSALYLTLAHNLASGLGYTYHGKPSAAAYPGLPYALSLVFRLLPGWHHNPLNLAAENVLMPLLGLATLGLVYRLMRLNSGRPTAVLVTCFVGLTRTFYRAAFALMTEMPFLLGVMAFLAGFEGMMQRRDRTSGQRWADGLLMLVGGAITIVMRPAWLAFVPVAVLALIGAGLRGRISWKITAAAVGIAGLAAVLFYAADPRGAAAGVFRFGRYEDEVFSRFHEPIQLAATVWGNALDIVRQVAINAMVGIKFGPSPDALGPRYWYDHLGAATNIIGALATLALGVSLLRRRALWGMWVAANIVMMLIVLPHERYFLQVLPLLVFAWWRGLRWLNHRLPAAAGNIVFFLIFGLGFVPNVSQVVGFVIEQRHVPFLAHYKVGKIPPLALVASARRIADVPADAVILAPEKSARILSYLSGRNVVESNDYKLDWPPASGSAFVLYDPRDAAMRPWLTSIGVTTTLPAIHGTNAKKWAVWFCSACRIH